MSHCQLGEKAPYFIHAQLVGRPTANKRLKLPHPKAIGRQRLGRVIPQFDAPFEVAVLLLPGGAPSGYRRRGRGPAGAGGSGGACGANAGSASGGLGPPAVGAMPAGLLAACIATLTLGTAGPASRSPMASAAWSLRSEER